jgi:hypothetical protein
MFFAAMVLDLGGAIIGAQARCVKSARARAIR